MAYQEILENARGCIGAYCKACPVCNGRACKNQITGPGAKGMGDTAARNFDKWQEIRVNMDNICENKMPDISLTIFGRTFRYPFFAGPVGAVNLHYGEKYNDLSYNDLMLRSCVESGIAAFTGDGAEGVRVYIEKLAAELRDTMSMCGAGSLAEITREMVRL